MNYQHGLDKTTGIIHMIIQNFVKQAQEYCDICPWKALADINERIADDIAAQRRQLENSTISKDPLRDRIDAEIAG